MSACNYYDCDKDCKWYKSISLNEYVSQYGYTNWKIEYDRKLWGRDYSWTKFRLIHCITNFPVWTKRFVAPFLPNLVVQLLKDVKSEWYEMKRMFKCQIEFWIFCWDVLQVTEFNNLPFLDFLHFSTALRSLLLNVGHPW